ncbi:YiiX/YebB-like N1pC/P60 family cysteine hydrolase [Asticcacaulis benevestitus]|uniref:YiiX/YebB-like N1pC/P60 family cysteine hydrolase n=1 Tax=Asticcacaulis benevestitus TaxID=347481 RepID=UPI0005534AD9|nr:YiiX/YebB-like N1pC/P60 family cysteine hydrolase [Asticcacaulis benevestitus]
MAKRILPCIVVLLAMVCMWRWLSFAPVLQDGDLIFQTSRSRQSTAIGVASLSLYTHMGIIKRTGDGTMVIEAVGPVKETPLKSWIKRGRFGRYAVYRLPKLQKSQTDKVFSASRGLYGRPYDPYFSFDNSAIYCSELVEYAFSAAKIKLGKRQRVDELIMLTGPAKKLLKRRALSDPQCRTKGLLGADCLDLIMKRQLVTPISIAQDQKVQQVYSNYPF